MLSTNFYRLLSIALLGSVLAACGGSPVPEGPVPTGISIYLAQEIDNRQIHFVWLELPSDLVVGSNEIRVFMARTDPPGLLVPTNIELPCIIQSENEYYDFRPVALPFEFDGTQIEGSYTWRACASCIECYMNWDTTMEIVGTMEQDTMSLAIGIRHMGHNIQDDFLRIELLQEEPTAREPGIQCRSTSDCLDLEFAPRP